MAKSIEKIAEEVTQAIKKPVEKSKEIDMTKVISTGSTLLDLNISGGKRRGGGIPGGMIVEIFGPPSSGKTALLSELCGSTQRQGGMVNFKDPEARYDLDYARSYGVNITDEELWEYGIPDTVKELFVGIRAFDPPNPDVINMVAGDSLAALTSELEIESDETSMKTNSSRSVEFSNELRKTIRLIERMGWVVTCSNQVRKFTTGEYVPGGKAMAFYSSLRIRIGPYPKDKYVEQSTKVEFEGKKISHKKTTAIRSKCVVKKSSLNDPFRECEVFIEFNRGIDDVRANLRYLKEKMGSTTFDCINTTYARINDAVHYVEKNGLVMPLREKVIDLWEALDSGFEKRPPKERF